jgi:hypothetical protein
MRRRNFMDNKMLNMSEAFIKLTESFLRLAKALKETRLSIDNMLRLQYREAGSPFGEGEEGLLLWREKLSKDFAVFCENAASGRIPERPSASEPEEILYLSEYFVSLKEEINTRTN